MAQSETDSLARSIRAPSLGRSTYGTSQSTYGAASASQYQASQTYPPPIPCSQLPPPSTKTPQKANTNTKGLKTQM
jgi:hypothetical protein